MGRDREAVILSMAWPGREETGRFLAASAETCRPV